MTAAGNTTTRLLGTFQKVDYVFIVGVAGGIPHYTDFKRHVRLGDVVISNPDQNRTSTKPYVYVYNGADGIKTYLPKDSCLQNISKCLQDDGKKPWETYLSEGIKHLEVSNINN